jgi:pimeloyl-ACP methyl ester carboxylesterase
MNRAALLIFASLLASAVAAEGVSDGSLPRSASQPFATERASEAEPLLRVKDLQPSSAAAAAGLRAGDVILAIDGETYDSPARGRRLLEQGRGGRPIALEVRRDGSNLRVRYVAPAAALEDIGGVTSRYGSIAIDDGLKLRTIVTRPLGASGRLPVIYFVQWLSCDSIEYPLNPEDHGWQTMLQLLASNSGVMLARTDKAGAGDSGGDCAELDYDTELTHHRAALAQLRADRDVDPERIVLFGASMGGNMAALLAAETKPAGLVIWGTAIKSWFEHLVEFNRRHLELSGRNPAEIAGVVSRQVAFLTEFLIHGKSPAEIAAADPALGAVWKEIRGSAGTRLYGRPYRFHQQAQAHDWVGAIATFGGPTLVLYGEFDWYEELDDHQLIARLIGRSRPGAARLIVVPNMDHHFSIYPSLEAAYRREGGLVAPQQPVLEIVHWVRALVRPPTT